MATSGHVVVGTDVSEEAQRAISSKVRNHLHLTPDVRVVQSNGYPALRVWVRQANAPMLPRGSYWVRSAPRVSKQPGAPLTTRSPTNQPRANRANQATIAQ